MKEPLVVKGDDIDIFETIKDAELYLEPWQIVELKLHGYDSEGRLLGFNSDGYNVRIHAAESFPTHQEHLKLMLAELIASNFDYDPASLDLHGMWELAKQRYTR